MKNICTARLRKQAVAFGISVVAAALAVQPTLDAAQRLGFQAQSIQGNTVEVKAGRLTAVCFLGTECPMARSYVGVLNELHRSYGSSNLLVVGVVSNLQDSAEDVRLYAEEVGVGFPLIDDQRQQIADQYGATRTPEVFLLDSKLMLRYHGRIDDQYAPGAAKSSATRDDLKIAIDELLSGKPVSIRETKALGCIIGRPKTPHIDSKDTAVTFTADIFAVLSRNCLECHRDGDIGPFSMQRYDDVVGWADTMLETVEQGRMPPWHAAPEHGTFANQRRMSSRDKDLLAKWIEQGTPEGDPSLLPEMPSYVSDWQLSRTPDAVFPMRNRPFVVPRDGVVEYQYFVVDPGFEEDQWVSAAQVLPGKRDVVHHAIVFVRPPDGERFRGVGWLTAYVPGQRVPSLPKGYARRIPAGSKLVFQMHYTPNGTVREDISQVGMQMIDPDEVTHEVYTIAALEQEFEIPPGAREHSVSAAVSRIPKNANLLAATPHMHVRGKSFTLRTGRSESDILLKVPNYDFNWQHTYQFAEPIDLGTIEELRFDASFDNSQNNPFNPDPSQWVTWGDQTWEEMAVAFFEVAVPLEAEQREPESQRSDRSRLADKKIRQYVAKVLEAMDANGDGVILRSEAAIVVRHRGFWRWDRNGDDRVTQEELRDVAERLFR